MSETAKKIRSIRESEGLSRTAFSEVVGMSVRTLETIENRGSDPATEITRKICQKFPQYTFWLTLDKVQPEIGQISPEIAETVSVYRQTGTDTE